MKGGFDDGEVASWWNDEGGANEEKPLDELTESEKNKWRDFSDWDEKDQDEWMSKRGLPKEAKYEDYQLEGEKENYKEVLVTMPVAKSIQEYEVEQDYRTPNTFYAVNKKTGVKLKFGSYELAKSQAERLSKEAQPDFDKQFKSSHFDEPNILVHLRMNTRVDAEGKKVLFLEEIQSDWGQKGKKEGFANDFTSENIKIIGTPSETSPFEFEIAGIKDRGKLREGETIREWKERTANDYKKHNIGVSNTELS